LIGLVEVANRPGGVILAMPVLAAGLLIAGCWGIGLANGEALPARPRPGRLAWIVAGGLILAHLGFVTARLPSFHGIDAATTTIEAATIVAHGGNPYAEPATGPVIDDEAMKQMVGRVPDARHFGGYKYLPVMTAGYMPLGLSMGEHGIVLTNLALTLAMLALVFSIGRQVAGPFGAWLGLVWLAALPILFLQAYAKAVPDLLPIVLILAGIRLWQRHPALAGLCMGLGLAAKLVPALIVLPLFLPRARRSLVLYLGGAIIGCLPILPYALMDWPAFRDNILVFNTIRAPDRTSWLADMPVLVIQVLRFLFNIGWLALIGITVGQAADIPKRLAASGVALIALLLVGPVMHQNYMLWWLPLLALMLAYAADPRPPLSAGHAGAGSV
jgi:hypothetical protein